VMSALGEEERTDGGHSAVADDCYAFGHGEILRLGMGDYQLRL
jgi:hypothetical protein